MKKGSIVKGVFSIGVLDKIGRTGIKIKYVKGKHTNFLYTNGFIPIKSIKVPTKKEKEEYKKFLLKNGYSYYRGKVTKEL